MPVDRAVLGLFCDLIIENGVGSTVGDIGCGPGRLAPYFAGRGLEPHGVDLSPGMIRVARRDYPGFPFDVADVRNLPFEDSSLAGVVCWYSPEEMQRQVTDAGFRVIVWLGRPADPDEQQPQGYLVAQRLLN